jgi:tRNA U34 2-thiouridine synthase MnmA/TrmU
MSEPIRAVALLSGGLDSTLAIRVVQEQGIAVVAINFSTAFCTCTPKGQGCSSSRRAADQLGVELQVQVLTDEYYQLLKDPPHGFGRALNPCIDCRILKLKKSAKLMRERGASFLITGEVLGQRPMSQRRDALRIIDRDSGLEGLILRPLSAQHLPPTVPEREGWVDRGKLLAISGRSRKVQMELAEHFGIHDYPCPAGGCLLTEPEFARKLKDLMTWKPDFATHDVTLLKVGRHFRLPHGSRLLVGKNERENQRLQALARESEILLDTEGVPGPLALLQNDGGEEDLRLAAAIMARYVKAAGPIRFRVSRGPEGPGRELLAEALAPEAVDRYRI